MINYVAFFTSILLAGIAAYFSVVGLSTIFAGAFWSVIVMGGALEFGKLVTAAWLHLKWDEINRAFKYYLSFAVIVLMLITSMGIFGFLSKAHIDSQTAIADNSIEMRLIEQNIQREQKVIDYVDSQFEILDNASEQWISNGYITRALQERENQADDRRQLARQQAEATEKINELILTKSELEREAVRQSAEIGPIKYVAEILYGDQAEDYIDNAARWVIFAIIFVFDPVAVLLLIASSGMIARGREPIDFGDYTMVPTSKIDDSFNDQRERLKQRKKEMFPTDGGHF
jgi:hypothetical protein